MNRQLRYTVLTAILALTLSACGDAPAQPAQPTPTVLTKSTAAIPTTIQGNPGSVDSRGSGNASIIDVVVTGGPHAGTYQRRSSNATCSANLTGNGSWGNQYSDPDIKDSLSSLQLIVDSQTEGADGTSKFLTTFTFGDILSPTATKYEYDGRGNSRKSQSGIVKIEGGDQNAKVTIHIEPEGGVKIDATIQCNEVVRGIAAEATRTPGPQDETARLNVTLTGGEPAGTFEAISTEEGTCGYGPGGGSVLIEGVEDPSDAFTVEYYKEGDKVNKFWLLVPKTKEATSSAGTQTFYTEINEDQAYYIDNQSGAGTDGTGTVKIQNNGNTATVNFDATTKDGKTIKATIECRAVRR
jgi:hypothetical protein